VLEGIRFVLEGIRFVLEGTRLVLEGIRLVLEGTRLVLEGTRFVLEGIRAAVRGPVHRHLALPATAARSPDDLAGAADELGLRAPATGEKHDRLRDKAADAAAVARPLRCGSAAC
jgi:hypothetical protein